MESKKQDIIRAAARLFSEKGYNNTSVDEIAKESGIAKASFYKLFFSKEDVLLESLVLFQEDLEKRIKPLYGLTDLTPKERLIRYTIAYLESTFDNKVHLLLFTAHDMFSANNEKLVNLRTDLETNLNLWIKECLLDVFGESIEPFVWDITFLMRGIAVEYMRVYTPSEKAMSARHLGEYIGDIVEIVVSRLLERAAEYKPFWTVPPWFCHLGEPNPFLVGGQIRNVLGNLEQAVAHCACSDEDRQDYLQVLQQLRRGVQEEELSSGVMKACLTFLEKRSELRKDCEELRGLLNLPM